MTKDTVAPAFSVAKYGNNVRPWWSDLSGGFHEQTLPSTASLRRTRGGYAGRYPRRAGDLHPDRAGLCLGVGPNRMGAFQQFSGPGVEGQSGGVKPFNFPSVNPPS